MLRCFNTLLLGGLGPPASLLTNIIADIAHPTLNSVNLGILENASRMASVPSKDNKKKLREIILYLLAKTGFG
jgi:hypothetical protein